MDTGVDHAPSLPRGASLLALVSILLAGLAAAILPPSPTPVDSAAPADVFSAGRAAAHIDEIASTPRVPGTPEHTAARDYLVSALEELGWRTSVQSGVGWTARGDPPVQRGTRVGNVIAMIPGSDPTGTVVLAAHYDTVLGSPGAGDDGIGLGTALETARALGAGPRPRNDIMVLFTDGEENGLLGSQVFSRSRSPALGPTVVLNHEARGNAGTATTFRMTSPNGLLLDALTRSPWAEADSLTQLLFEALPNDTDFRNFTEAGFSGFDTAIAAGAAYYHSPLDTPDRLSRESLQQMGDTSLSTARILADTDLMTLDDGVDEVVSLVPWGLLHYPRWVEIAGAVLLLVAVAVLVVVRVRRRDATSLQILATGALTVVAGMVAAALAWLPWWLAQQVSPGMAAPVAEEPYRPGPFQIAAVAAALGLLFVVAAALRRRVPGPALTCGAFLAVALLALLGTPFPGAASTLVLPVLPAVVAVLVTLLLPADAVYRRLAVLTLGALPGAVLGVRAILVSFDAGLVAGAPGAGIFVALTFAATLPLWEPILRETSIRWSALAALVLVAVCTVAAGGVNRDGATDPRQEYLWYALDTDNGTATWASPDPPRSAWSKTLLTASAAPLPELFPWRADESLSHGAAPVADLVPPDVEVLEDTSAGGARELRLRLSSPRGAPAVWLWFDNATATVHGATVDGQRAEPSSDFGFMFWAPGPNGIEVTLTLGVLSDRLGVRVSDLSGDLSVVPGYEPPTDRAVVQPSVVVTRALEI
ncbi:MAG: M28 family peptidase [Rhodococcus sp. (in: high G+C Gram-positive bacteria)]|uniref:M28 family peptidase n=1 Tax=Rhodococcus sp. TaxID=1831 RepID=UPI003D9BB352